MIISAQKQFKYHEKRRYHSEVSHSESDHSNCKPKYIYWEHPLRQEGPWLMNASGRYGSNKLGTYFLYIEKNVGLGIRKTLVSRNTPACQCYTLNWIS